MKKKSVELLTRKEYVPWNIPYPEKIIGGYYYITRYDNINQLPNIINEIGTRLVKLENGESKQVNAIKWIDENIK